MSGFEIAGVALGAFPILLEGLKFYISSVETVKTLWRPRRVLTRLATQVRMESAKLRNTMERLLHDLVDEDEMSSLVLHGKGWGDEGLSNKLTHALGKDYLIRNFIDAVQLMCEDLESLMSKLRITAYGPNSGQPAKQLTRDRWKEFIIILEMSDIKNLLDSIFRSNQDLDGISRSLRAYEQPNWRPQIPSALAKRYKVMRDHATHLYRLFQRKLSSPECNCLVKHFVSMQLEAIPSTLTLKRGQVHSSQPGEKWSSKMMIAFQHGTSGSLYDWLEIEVQLNGSNSEITSERLMETRVSGMADVLISRNGKRPASKQSDEQSGQDYHDDSPKIKSNNWRSIFPGTSKSSSKEVTISSSIQVPRLSPTSPKAQSKSAMPATTPKRKIAFDLPSPSEERKSEGSKLREINTYSHSFCTLVNVIRGTLTVQSLEISDEKAGLSYLIEPKVCAAQKTQALSLEELLEPEIISKDHRLMIAIQLASTVLHLYQTDWLPDIWGSRNIFFLMQSRKCRIADGQYIITLEPVLSKPLIERVPMPVMENPQKERTGVFQLGVYNQTIFSLGIVLIELGMEKALERITENGVISMEHMAIVTRNMGAQYATVAASCLFGLSAGSGKLDDKKLRNEFYEKVILPLEDALTCLKEAEV